MVDKPYKAIVTMGWLTFALTLCHAAEVTFIEAMPFQTQPMTMKFWDTLIEDFNGDGHLDVVGAATVGLSCGAFAATYLYINDGSFDPQFIQVQVGGGSCADSGSLQSGDVNQDGRMDIVLPSSVGMVVLFLNGGQAEPVFSSFTIADSGPPYPGRAYRTAGIVDIDDDGDQDIAVINSSGRGFFSTVWLLENDGQTTPTFNERIIHRPGQSDLVTVDLNGDGPVDMMRLPGVGTSIELLQNTGDVPSSFTVRNLTLNEGGVVTIQNVADMDGDDDVDILGFYKPEEGDTQLESYWFENDGNDPPSFTRHFIGVRTGEKMMAADLDLDGDVDVLDWTCEFFWYENIDGRGTEFQYHFGGDPSPLGEVQHVSLGDLDGDGDTDIIYAVAQTTKGSLSGALGWFENMTIDKTAVPGDGWLMFE